MIRIDSSDNFEENSQFINYQPQELQTIFEDSNFTLNFNQNYFFSNKDEEINNEPPIDLNSKFYIQIEPLNRFESNFSSKSIPKSKPKSKAKKSSNAKDCTLKKKLTSFETSCKIQMNFTPFSKNQKKRAIQKYLLKRRNRNYSKIVRYERRQELAGERPRYKGRFIKPEKLANLLQNNENSFGHKFGN